MTKKDLGIITGIHRSDINKAFVAASKAMPSIRIKTARCRRAGSRGQADFTLEEVLLAASYLRGGKGLTVLEEELVRELYTTPKSDVELTNPWQGYIAGTREFMAEYTGQTRCCSVCEYCVAKRTSGKHKPFCNLYFTFIRGKSPYKAWCMTFSRSDTIMLFRKNGPPIMKGEQIKQVKLAGFSLDFLK